MTGMTVGKRPRATGRQTEFKRRLKYSRFAEVLKHLLIALVRGYQLLISPLLGPRCRFYPSCSQYAVEALSSHGVWSGTVLTVRRVCRCHPWGGSGYDPVPPLASDVFHHDPYQAFRPIPQFRAMGRGQPIRRCVPMREFTEV